ncbi:sugar phosphate isomerase/epimerase family protein [Elioraea sp.]|uniref:sugar phosphate isomerase/epimerase family protein n=1 Tax=Elioraea sp. TaxID=2185103 RepID=UPI003F711971
MTDTITAYGLSTEGRCEPEPLAQELALFAEAGCTAAEISLQNSFAVTGGRVNGPEVEALAAVLRRFPLRYTVHGPLGMNLMDAAHHDLHRAVCRAMIEATGALGAGVLVVHSGVWERGLAPAEIERRKRMEVEALRDLGEVAARHGVMLALENLPPLPTIPETHDAWGIAAQVAAVGHPNVGATLDIGHAAMMAAAKQQDLAASIAAMAPYVVHLHLQDQFGRLDTIRLPGSGEKLAYGTGDLHAPPGWGEIPFERLLGSFAPRAGTVMIYELAEKFFRFVPETATALRRFATMVGTARQAA